MHIVAQEMLSFMARSCPSPDGRPSGLLVFGQSGCHPRTFILRENVKPPLVAFLIRPRRFDESVDNLKGFLLGVLTSP